ncbi:MAG: GC-type dockerin domain-anchored protein [Planctomycetota bacterium]|nr:GC-type dockerin domain-anchored protein [Planctomycetota bacterium]
MQSASHADASVSGLGRGLGRGLLRTLSAFTLACLAAPALAQTPGPLTNSSFEQLNPFSASGEPVAWHNLSNPLQCIRRTNGDGISPAITARTGTACVEIKAPTAGFRGWTTDTLDFSTFLFYDPAFTWGGGDIIVSGWYNIPASQPISGDACGIKLNVKYGNQDYGTYDPFGFPAPGPQITGHTNGEWRYWEVRWTQAQIEASVADGESKGYFQTPPYPDHCKITLGRFGYAPPSGTIFWDDIQFTQVSACPADFNGDGFLDFTDFDDFVGSFEAGNATSDFNGDGFLDFTDFDAFVAAFEAGC